MAHFAIFCPEAVGHLFPIGTLGLELRRRGHDVTIVARSIAAPIAERLDLPLRVIPTEDGPRYRRPALPLILAAGLVGMRPYLALRARFRYVAEFMLELAPPILKELAVDGLLIDQTLLAGGTIAEHLGLPFVTVCSALHWNAEANIPPHFTGWPYSTSDWSRRRNALGYGVWERYLKPALQMLNRYRKAWNLAPIRGSADLDSRLAEIAQTCPEFDFPRHKLPETFHYVGALAAGRNVAEDHFPWDRLDGRPLIYASLGTVQTNRIPSIFQKIAEACDGLDAQLVISAGKWAKGGDTSGQDLRHLPGNPVVVDFAPQLALLAKARLLITHAGQNTVVEALLNAVPMVGLPRGADQPALAARIECAGVGLSAPFFRPRARQLRALVQRVLLDPSYRERALQLRQAMAAAGGCPRAADIAERALTTSRPVTR